MAQTVRFSNVFVKRCFSIALLCCACLFSNNGIGQKRYNIWAVGDHSGFNFNTTPASAIDSTQIAEDPDYNVLTYGASICDKNGKLLFYTDGWEAWNQRHQLIQKSNGKWPWSGHVLPLIIPYPNDDSLYYVFGVSNASYAFRLQYLTFDMRLNGWLGGIKYPDNPTLSNYFTILLGNASMFIAGTAHCNRHDTWVISHSNDAFYSFLVTDNGVDSIPVVSKIPASALPAGKYDEKINVRFSPSGDRLIMPLVSQNLVLVFDFNNYTGIFSNPRAIHVPEGDQLSDAEISPNGTKLYLSSYRSEENLPEIFLHYVAQYDLEAGTPAQIENSRVEMTQFPDREGCTPHGCFLIRRTLELGPDGKIYISMREVTYLDQDKTASVIEYPNEAGYRASYKKNKIKLKRKYKYFKYNYVRSSSFTIQENGIQYQKKVCVDDPVNFSLLSKEVDSVRWDFGDSTADSDNYSTLVTTSHQYPGPGKYKVSAVIHARCFTDTAFSEVEILPEYAVRIPETVKDSVVCVGTVLQMDATTPFATDYLWGGGNTSPIQPIKVSSSYVIDVSNACSVDSRKFFVAFEECNCKVNIPTGFTPNGDQLNDVFRPLIDCMGLSDDKGYSFKIYDRFGSVIFSSTKKNKGWDGTIRGQQAPVGVYTWMFNYIDPNTKKPQMQYGKITLIR